MKIGSIIAEFVASHVSKENFGLEELMEMKKMVQNCSTLAEIEGFFQDSEEDEMFDQYCACLDQLPDMEVAGSSVKLADGTEMVVEE